MRTSTSFKSIKRTVAIGLLMILSLYGATVQAQFYQFDAIRSGHWNDPTVWRNQKAPGTTCTGVNIRISEGVTVYMDSSLTLCGDTLKGNSFMVNGKLMGDSTCLTFKHLNLFGSGVVVADSLLVSDHTNLSLTGSITCDHLINRCDTLFIRTGNLNINKGLNLENGILTSTRFGRIHFSDSCTVENAGGQWINDGCTWSDSTRLHLNITSCRDSLKAIPGARWGDVTINLNSSNDSLQLGNDFMCTGSLKLQRGILKLNRHQLIMNGNFLGDSGRIQCDSLSRIVLNGTEPEYRIRFAEGRQYLGKLIARNNCKTILEGDVVITDSLELQNGILDISAASFDVRGTISMINSMFAGNRKTKFTLGGSNKRDTIRFAAGKDTLGSLKVDPSKFMLTLGSNLRVADSLLLNNTKLQIRNGVLSLDSSCVLKGFNRNSYIVTGDSGSLQRRGRGNGKELDFPIGTVNDFAPACITPTKGHDSIAYCVSAAYGVLAKGLTGDSLSATNPFVKTTWHVTCTADSFKMTLKLKWPKNLETPGFNRVRCFISHFEHERWDSVPPTVCDSTTDSTLVSLTRTDIQTLSPFTIMSANAPTSIADQQQSNVVVYPNPATDFVRFNSTASGRLILVDITGRIQRNVPLSSENSTVNVSDLPAGLYLYKITNKGKVAATGKLAIKK